jgi:hypothetical protein
MSLQAFSMRTLLVDPVLQLAMTVLFCSVLYVVSLYRGRRPTFMRTAACATAIPLGIALLFFVIEVVANGKGSLIGALFIAFFLYPSAAAALACLGIWMVCERTGVPYVRPLVVMPLSVAALDMFIRAGGYLPDIR